MPKSGSCSKTNPWLFLGLLFISVLHSTAQSPETLRQFFEGKPVTVKLDMPASQKGVDIFPDRPQPLDTKSYSKRLKQFGTSLRNGDAVMVTKLKAKSDSVEFQLGGGGYGTALDQTDASVHFRPAEKSAHEKELEDQLSKETDDDRRRSVSRELDDLRRDRERQDRRDREQAENDADSRRQQIDAGRQQGGSRFNIRFEKNKSGNTVTPQALMEILSAYVNFGAHTPGSDNNRMEGVRSDPAGPPPPQAPTGDSAVKNLKKGLTREQVEALLGPATEARDQTQDALKVTTCTYQSASETVHASFVNGVLVEYTVSSR